MQALNACKFMISIILNIARYFFVFILYFLPDAVLKPTKSHCNIFKNAELPLQHRWWRSFLANGAPFNLLDSHTHTHTNTTEQILISDLGSFVAIWLCSFGAQSTYLLYFDSFCLSDAYLRRRARHAFDRGVAAIFCFLCASFVIAVVGLEAHTNVHNKLFAR